MSLTSTDLFAGGGGSSEGMSQVAGVKVLIAANHWKLAMDTHQLNHPDAALLPQETPADMLDWGSAASSPTRSPWRWRSPAAIGCWATSGRAHASQVMPSPRQWPAT